MFVKGGVISLVGAVWLFLDRQTGSKGQSAWWESFQIEYRKSYFYFYHTDCYMFEVLPKSRWSLLVYSIGRVLCNWKVSAWAERKKVKDTWGLVF